jgi:hypothetical protein
VSVPKRVTWWQFLRAATILVTLRVKIEMR